MTHSMPIEDLKSTQTIRKTGHPLLYHALQTVDSLARTGYSTWRFLVAEFPVRVKDFDTRVDFVLESQCRRLRMVVECKHVNTRYSRWVFAQAPFIHRGRIGEYFHAEQLHFYGSGDGEWDAVRGSASLDSHAAHQGFVVELDEKGTGQKGDSDAIEHAAFQLLKGLNGLVEHDWNTRPSRASPSTILYVPVILTTAELLVCESDLAVAFSQEPSPAPLQFKSVDYVYLQYPSSIGIRHSFNQVSRDTGVLDSLNRHSIRTILVVSLGFWETCLKCFTSERMGLEKTFSLRESNGIR